MKTESQIRKDIEELISKAKEENKAPRVSKYLSILNAARLGNRDLIIQERKKIVNELDKLDSIFPEYLKHFVYFRLADENQHRKKVLAQFKKETFQSKKVGQLRVLNYLLGDSDKI